MIKYGENHRVHNPRHQTTEMKSILKQQMARNMGDRLKEDELMLFTEFLPADSPGAIDIQNCLYVVHEDELKEIRRIILALRYSRNLEATDYIRVKELEKLIFNHTDITL